MSAQDKLEMIKVGFESELAMVEMEKAAVAAKLQAVVEATAEYESEKIAFGDAKYLEGKASIVLPDPTSPDKIFTQADMDQLASVAKAEKAAELQPLVDAAKVEAEEAKAMAEAAKIAAETSAAEAAGFKLDAENIKAEAEAAKLEAATNAAKVSAMAEEFSVYKAKVQAELDQDKTALA